MGFEPQENFRRLQHCETLGLINKTVEFNSVVNNRHVAVFRDPIDEFISGRILFYQKAIYRRIGAYPEITKAIPSCLKVFFSVEGLNAASESLLTSYFNSESFAGDCEQVDIAYVQFCGKLYYPS